MGFWNKWVEEPWKDFADQVKEIGTDDLNAFNDPAELFGPNKRDAAPPATSDIAANIPSPAVMPIPEKPAQARQRNAREKKKRRGRQSTILTTMSMEDPLGG